MVFFHAIKFVVDSTSYWILGQFFILFQLSAGVCMRPWIYSQRTRFCVLCCIKKSQGKILRWQRSRKTDTLNWKNKQKHSLQTYNVFGLNWRTCKNSGTFEQKISLKFDMLRQLICSWPFSYFLNIHSSEMSKLISVI